MGTVLGPCQHLGAVGVRSARAVGGSRYAIARAYFRGVDHDRCDGSERVIVADGEHDDAVYRLRVRGMRRFDRRSRHVHHLVVFLDAFGVERVVERHVGVRCAAACAFGEEGH